MKTNFENIHIAAKILIDFHSSYFNAKDVLSSEAKENRFHNLVVLFQYFENEVNLNVANINIFLRNNARAKDKSQNVKARELRHSLIALKHLITFLIAKCSLAEDLNYSKVLLSGIPADWERAYAAKLLSFIVDNSVYIFCRNNNIDKLLTDECTKVIEKFTNCFNDFNLIKLISKQKSKNLQCLLYLLVRTVDNILSLLQVDFNEDERKVAHYTSLFGFNKIICEKSPLRLASGDLMNDPSEGKLLYEYFNIQNELSDDTFLTSFTFNHNSLNQFRLYGCTDNKEGTGISLVVDGNFFSSERNGFISSEIVGDLDIFKVSIDKNSELLPLFRCVYFDKNTGFIQVAKRSRASFYQEYYSELNLDEIHSKYEQYESNILNLESNLYKQIQNLKDLISLTRKYFSKNKDNEELIKATLRPLCFLFKHIAFQEEQECRIFYITEISNPILQEDQSSMMVFFPYKTDIKASLKNVYLGPALQNKFTFVRKSVAFNKGVKVKVCDSPFVPK
ncbi:DUF2971 domain-containing protein [Acinetobacter sp. YH12041]|uniref:DUF2971 domain-containing protein n=1 Tax=Acinetobacter sp. YH12041 TaxID=2601049 RepID=UPI0015D10CE7|nr:DUF2971 domain-containing protein [Acinetobacter sp. YH12041]